MLELFYDYRLYNNPRYFLAERSEVDMQAVPDEVRKSVVFIYYENKVGGTELAGTGFFVSKEIEGTDGMSIYLVTAKHVIAWIKQKSKDNGVYLRINTKDGSSKGVKCHTSQWKEYPNDTSVDIAMLAWAPDQNEFDYLTLPTTMAATKDAVAEHGIGAGDEVFLTGLFSNHFGETKNLPIIRVGNIALLSGDKIKTKDFGLIDAYLIEARSIGGLSGSPVFVYLGHMRPKNGNLNFGSGSPLFLWLGVMHGHWQVDEGAIDTITSEPKNVNMGIGIVVPATKVLEIIDKQEDFVKARKDAKKEFEKANLPIQDSLADVDISKADFEKTLKKVAKKSNPSESDKQKGGTIEKHKQK